MKKFSIVLFLFLNSCVTQYQPKSFSGGYADTRIDKNIFRVSFSGNGYTAKERVQDFVLLRSAELALENGFEYFIIVNSENTTDYSSYTSPENHTTQGSVNMYGNTATYNSHTVSTGGQTYLISKPSSTNLILCFKEKPEVNSIVYNASFISSSIKKKYNL